VLSVLSVLSVLRVTGAWDNTELNDEDMAGADGEDFSESVGFGDLTDTSILELPLLGSATGATSVDEAKVG